MRYLILNELLVEHVSIKSQFGFMASFYGLLLVVCVIVSPTCKVCDPTCVFEVDDGKFTT